MKKCFTLWFLLTCSSVLVSQITFTVPPTACLNTSLALSVNTGTLVNPQITWVASPNALFSNSVSPTTNVTFTSGGTHSILVVATSGTNLATAQNTIQVISSPVPLLTISSPSVCPLNTYTLSVNTPSVGSPNFTFSLPGGSLVSTGSTSTLQITTPATLPAVYAVTVDVGGCQGSAFVSAPSSVLVPTIITTASAVCQGYAATLTGFGGFNYTFVTISPGQNTVAVSQSVAVSPTVPTVYMVTTESMNCTGTATMAIGIAPPLNIVAMASSPTTCIEVNQPKYSKPVTLSATGGATWSGFPPGVIFPPKPTIVRPLSTTCYTANLASAICSGSAVVCVTVIPQFTIGVVPVSPTLCLLESTPLSVIGVSPVTAYSYSWTEPVNAPLSLDSLFSGTVTASPQSSAVYTVQAYDALGCISLPQTASVEVVACTSLDEKSRLENSIVFFPNPASETLNIETNEDGEYLSIQIYDLTGRIVLAKEIKTTGKVKIIDLTLANGVYFITITFGSDKKISKKLLITEM